MAPLERYSSDLSEYTLFQIQKIFSIYKTQILGEKGKFEGFFLHFFFFKLFPKLSDLLNSDDCIEKNTSKSIRLYPVFIQK